MTAIFPEGASKIDLRGGIEVVMAAASRIAASLMDDQPVVIDLSNYDRAGDWIAVSIESTSVPSELAPKEGRRTK